MTIQANKKQTYTQMGSDTNVNNSKIIRIEQMPNNTDYN